MTRPQDVESVTIESKAADDKPHRWHRWPRWKRLLLIGLAVGTVLVIVTVATTVTLQQRGHSANLSALDSGLTVLLKNDLNTSKESNGLLVLGKPQSHEDAEKHCEDLNELLSTFPSEVYRGLLPRLQSNSSESSQQFWIASGNETGCNAVDQFGAFRTFDCSRALPALCAQSAPVANTIQADLSRRWQITLEMRSQQNITGYRDKRSFRFLGIPFANQPARWTHSSLSESREPVRALIPGRPCKQSDSPSSIEHCLFLNVYTPFLPYRNTNLATNHLKPVMVFIHGGSFTSGDSIGPFLDGGNLASRGDVVVVSINYRVGIFGFLALSNNATRGNYGLGDQITALRWVRRNIHSFGGDPEHITIFGQSAGAASVRALLTSPMTMDLGISAAIMQSSPGGRGMGRPYSHYLTIPQVSQYIYPVLQATGCADAQSQLACLRRVSSDDLVTHGSDLLRLDGVNQASIVQDGTIINSTGLNFDRSLASRRIPLIIGNMHDDAAFFMPNPGESRLGPSLQIAPLSLPGSMTAALSRYTDSTPFAALLAPSTSSNDTIHDTAFDVFNVTNHVATLGIFSCYARATAFAASMQSNLNSTYIYQMDRAYINYEQKPFCDSPITLKYPKGNPYTGLDCHSGDNAFVFGNLNHRFIRDEYDYPFARQMVDTWASFARTGNPNPDPDWMRAMGYDLHYGLHNEGPWTPTSPSNLLQRRLGPIGSGMIPFAGGVDAQFCDIMDLPLDMYT